MHQQLYIKHKLVETTVGSLLFAVSLRRFAIERVEH